jgi:hypothetical protein
MMFGLFLLSLARYWKDFSAAQTDLPTLLRARPFLFYGGYSRAALLVLQ